MGPTQDSADRLENTGFVPIAIVELTIRFFRLPHYERFNVVTTNISNRFLIGPVNTYSNNFAFAIELP